MNQPFPALVSSASPESPSTRLRGWRLAVARTLTFTAMAVVSGLFALSLPGLVPQLAAPCADAPNTCLIAPRQVAPLAKLGITPHALALAVTTLSCVAILLAMGVAAVLIWRRSDDWMALLVALTFVLMPLQFTPVLLGLSGTWQAPIQIIQNAGIAAFLLLIGIFPSGRFVPRWLWLPIVVVALYVSQVGPHLPPAFSLLPILCAVLSLIASQIYRYRRISTPVQREQTKWVLYGLALALFVNQLFWQTYGTIPALNQPDSLYSLLAFPDSLLAIGILAVFFSIAILRSRLFDIDVIIRRTLIYGSLTALLAAVYFAVVLGAQAVVAALTGQSGQHPVIIVASTLLIAALFTPLRRGLQATIDRRFYRRKYDVAKTLAAFGSTLRTETNLAALSDHVVTAVRETMQPAHISLWLAPTRQAPHHQMAESSQRRESRGQGLP